MARFSQATRKYLESVGWHENQHKERSVIVSEILDDDFEPLDTAIAFLQEFHGLCIRGFTFTVKECRIDSLAVERLGNYLGISLCPIGADTLTTLLIDSDGKIYWEANTYALDFIAHSADQAIEHITMYGRHLESIGVAILDGEEFRRVFLDKN